MLNGKLCLSENDKVIVLGFAGIKTKKALISEMRESVVLGIANRMNSECYMFQQNTIYVGMSGGPVWRV